MAEGPKPAFSFFKDQWQGWKGFWCDRFAFLENFSRFTVREKALPPWSDSDVDEFISSDPIHGPTLKTAREAAMFGIAGSAIGGASLAAISWKYSKSPHGAIIALGSGAASGWVFGHEVANHWFQLYKIDTITAQTKFMEWWEKKSEGY